MHAKGALGTARIGDFTVPVLHLAKNGFDIIPAPAWCDSLPFSVIVAVATDVNHRVNRRRPSEDFTTRPIGALVGMIWGGFSDVFPVDARIVKYFTIAYRDLDPRAVVSAACL